MPKKPFIITASVTRYNCDKNKFLEVNHKLGDVRLTASDYLVRDSKLQLKKSQNKSDSLWTGTLKGRFIMLGLLSEIVVTFDLDGVHRKPEKITFSSSDCSVGSFTGTIETDVKSCSNKNISASRVFKGKGEFVNPLGLLLKPEAELFYYPCDLSQGLKATLKQQFQYDKFGLGFLKFSGKLSIIRKFEEEEEEDIDFKRKAGGESKSNFATGGESEGQSYAQMFEQEYTGEVTIGKLTGEGTIVMECGKTIRKIELKATISTSEIEVNATFDYKKADLSDHAQSWSKYMGNIDLADCTRFEGGAQLAWKSQKIKFEASVRYLKCPLNGYSWTPLFISGEFDPVDLIKMKLGSFLAPRSPSLKNVLIDDIASWHISVKLKIEMVYETEEEDKEGEEDEKEVEPTGRRRKSRSLIDRNTKTHRIQVSLHSPDFFGVEAKLTIGIGKQNEKNLFYIVIIMARSESGHGLLLNLLKNLNLRKIRLSIASHEQVSPEGSVIHKGVAARATFPIPSFAGKIVESGYSFGKGLDVPELQADVAFYYDPKVKMELAIGLMAGGKGVKLFGDIVLFRVAFIASVMKGVKLEVTFGFQIHMGVYLGEDEHRQLLDMQLVLEVVFQLPKFGVEGQVMVGTECPQITHKKYCSTELFCCWSDPLGFSEGLTIVFPFFFAMGIAIAPVPGVDMIAFQFAILLGEMSLQMALQFATDPTKFAFFIKFENVHLGKIIEELMPIKGFLGFLTDTIFAISVERLEISINPSGQLINIGTAAVRPGFTIDIRKFNLWNFIKVDRAYMSFNKKSGFALIIKLPPFSLFGIATFGFKKDGGTVIDIKLGLYGMHFKLKGGISLLRGLIEKNVNMEIKASRLYCSFEFSIFGFNFNFTLQGPSPNENPSPGNKKVKVRPVSKATCSKSLRAGKKPNTVDVFGKCKKLHSIMSLDKLLSLSIPIPEILSARYLNASSYMDWYEHFGEVACPQGKSGAFLKGWTIKSCDHWSEYKGMFKCVRDVDTVELTTKYSKFINAPINRMKFGLEDLKNIGLVSCGKDYALTNFKFAPPPGKLDERNWRSRGFHLGCMKPNTTKYRFVPNSEKRVEGKCSPITGSAMDHSMINGDDLTGETQCPGTMVMRAFQLKDCTLGDSLEDANKMIIAHNKFLEDLRKVGLYENTKPLPLLTVKPLSLPGMQFEYTCVGVELWETAPNVPKNIRKPIRGFSFEDVKGDLLQLEYCEGGEVENTKKDQPTVRVNMVNVNMKNAIFGSQMECPKLYAMVAFHTTWMECMKMEVLIHYVAKYKFLNTKWTKAFSIGTAMTCPNGLVVGYSCGFGCVTKQLKCVDYITPSSEYLKLPDTLITQKEEVTYLLVYAKLDFSVGNFFQKVVEKLMQVLSKVKEILRDANRVVEAISGLLQKAIDALDRAQKSYNAKQDEKRATYARAQHNLDRKREERHYLQQRHDACSGWGCTSTFADLAAHHLLVEAAQLLLSSAKLALRGAAFVTNGAIDGLRKLVEKVKYHFDKVSYVFESVIEKLNEFSGDDSKFMKDMKSEKKVESFVDKILSIEEFSFKFEISNHALAVDIKLKGSIFKKAFDWSTHMELNFQKIMERIYLHFMGRLMDSTVADVDMKAAEQQSAALLAAAGIKRWSQVTNATMAAYHTYSRRRSSSGVAIPPSGSADYHEFMEAVLHEQITLRHGPHTGAEHVALQHFGQAARTIRKRRSRADWENRVFDNNLGLDSLCEAVNMSKDQRGFEMIKQTHSVKRSRQTTVVDLSECVFNDINPDLHSIYINEEKLRGHIPPLPRNSKLRNFAAANTGLSGNWDSFRRSAKNLKLLHLRNNKLEGTLERSWSSDLTSLEIGDNLFKLDPVAMFSTLQDLTQLESATYEDNIYELDQRFAQIARPQTGLSSLAARIKPDFSVLYGVLHMSEDWQNRICGTCDPEKVYPKHQCFLYACANQTAFAAFEGELSSALNGIVEFSNVQIDSLETDVVLFSARRVFTDLQAQDDILAYVQGERFAMDLGADLVDAIFGCTPGAIGPQCEYICPSGWARFGFNRNSGLSILESFYPKCEIPVSCGRECALELNNAMLQCTHSLYRRSPMQACLEAIGETSQTCRCTFYKANQQDYNGALARTVDGAKCKKWNSVPEFEISQPDPVEPLEDELLDANWNHNKCRNPEGSKDQAWCYTSEQGDWEFCDVGSPSRPQCLNEGDDCFEVAMVQFKEIFR